MKSQITITKLKERAEKSQKKLATQFPEVAQKLNQLGLDLKDLRRHSAKMISAAAITAAVLATTPLIHSAATPTGEARQLSPDESTKDLQQELSALLPKKVGPLTPDTESQ